MDPSWVCFKMFQFGGMGMGVESSRSTDCQLADCTNAKMGARHAPRLKCLMLFGLTWRKKKRLNTCFFFTRNKHISNFNIFMRVKHRRLAMGESCTIFVGFSPMSCFSWRSANSSRGPAESTCHSQSLTWKNRVCIHLANDKNVCNMS